MCGKLTRIKKNRDTRRKLQTLGKGMTMINVDYYYMQLPIVGFAIIDQIKHCLPNY